MLLGSILSCLVCTRGPCLLADYSGNQFISKSLLGDSMLTAGSRKCSLSLLRQENLTKLRKNTSRFSLLTYDH